MTGLTRQTAEFASAISPKAVPRECTDGARIGITDCVGVMLAGANEEAPRIVAGTVPTSTSNDAAPEIPSGRHLSAPDAALVNGVAAHGEDRSDRGQALENLRPTDVTGVDDALDSGKGRDRGRS